MTRAPLPVPPRYLLISRSTCQNTKMRNDQRFLLFPLKTFSFLIFFVKNNSTEKCERVLFRSLRSSTERIDPNLDLLNFQKFSNATMLRKKIPIKPCHISNPHETGRLRKVYVKCKNWMMIWLKYFFKTFPIITPHKSP